AELEWNRAYQFGILPSFGEEVSARAGKNMAVLSTNRARTPEYPDFVRQVTGIYIDSRLPTGFAGVNLPGCGNGPMVGGNSIKLTLKIRVPTNAHGFRFDTNFFTDAYPTYACSGLGNAFITLLDTKVAADPEHHGNIVFDEKGTVISPTAAFLRVCTPIYSAAP